MLHTWFVSISNYWACQFKTYWILVYKQLLIWSLVNFRPILVSNITIDNVIQTEMLPACFHALKTVFYNSCFSAGKVHKILGFSKQNIQIYFSLQKLDWSGSRFWSVTYGLTVYFESRNWKSTIYFFLDFKLICVVGNLSNTLHEIIGSNIKHSR